MDCLHTLLLASSVFHRSVHQDSHLPLSSETESGESVQIDPALDTNVDMKLLNQAKPLRPNVCVIDV